MRQEPRTRLALRLRQRKFEILRGLPRLADQLPGVLTESYTRCGKLNCRCARGKGHRAFSLTYMVDGKRHVDRSWRSERATKKSLGALFVSEGTVKGHHVNHILAKLGANGRTEAARIALKRGLVRSE